MCECGCTMSDVKYTFAGPAKSLYVLTLAGHCENCDAPPGVTIEWVKPDDPLYRDYKRGDWIEGPLTFEKWADSYGVAIIAGMVQSEFVKAMRSHLIGVSVKDFSERGKIDRISAETLLEEMYADSQVKPHFPPAAAAVTPGEGTEGT